MVNFFAISSFLAALLSLSSFYAHTAIYSMILSFLFSGILYYLLTATYLAMMLFVVYIGAVAMLFVFCVMLLNLSSRPNFAFSTSSYYFLVVYVVVFFPLSVIFYRLGAQPTFDFFSVDPGLLTVTAASGSASKDHLLMLALYGPQLPELVLIGVILFLVTILVTVVFGFVEHHNEK